MAEVRAQNALAEVQEFTSFLRVLGSYPMDMTPWSVPAAAVVVLENGKEESAEDCEVLDGLNGTALTKCKKKRKLNVEVSNTTLNLDLKCPSLTPLTGVELIPEKRLAKRSDLRNLVGTTQRSDALISLMLVYSVLLISSKFLGIANSKSF
ncbi:hypothetical protein ACFE04_025060 [Oxalis oulophora]